MRKVPLLVLSILALSSAAAASARVIPDEPLVSSEWWLAAVGADQVDPPGPGIPVTVIDSGLDVTHPEFAGRPDVVVLNEQTVNGNDEEGHGTAVASIVGAPANGIGLLGVYPQSLLRSWDASPNGRISDDSAIAGLQRAAQDCPGVINLSWGGPEPDSALDDAVNLAVHAGCIVVAAAGNEREEGNPRIYPAALPHVFTVAATDEHGNVTSFSTKSPGVDLAAPGQQMSIAWPKPFAPSGYITSGAGTSFSAPLVAGAAAWVWTIRRGLDASQVSELVRRTARDMEKPGFDDDSGWGLLDLPAALAGPAPTRDLQEPNEDVRLVSAKGLFGVASPPLNTPSRPNARLAGRLDPNEDPRDVYRVWIAPRKRLVVSSSGSVTLRLWGTATRSVGESGGALKRDLLAHAARSVSAKGGARGFYAYLDVAPTTGVRDVSYSLALSTR